MSTEEVKATLKLDVWSLYHGYMLLRKRWLVGLTILYVVLTAVALMGSLGDREQMKFNLVVFALIWAGYLFAFFVCPFFYCRGWLKEPGLAAPSQVTADDSGIVGRNSQMETTYQWSGFTGFREDRSLFALRLGKKMMMVVPKKSFESEPDVERFRDLLRRNIATDRKG